MEKDPLSQLLVDKVELDRKALADMLAPYANLDKETGSAVYTPKFSSLDNRGKIIVFLLSRKAGRLLGLPIEHEEATPTEISKHTGIKLGSVKPIVWNLEKRRTLMKKNESYLVSDHAMSHVGELIKEKAKGK